MSNIPKISVITFVHINDHNNRLPLLKECIESVANQNYPNYEHIIVDDGSTINFLPHIKDYAHIRYHKKLPSGIISTTYSFNDGHELADGDFLIYLPSDDLHLQNSLHALSECLVQAPNAVMAIGAAVINDGKTKKHHKPERIDVINKMSTGNIIHGCTVMWRRSSRLMQLLPVNYTGFCGDYDFFYTLAQMGEIAFTDEAVVEYRNVADSTRHKTQLKKAKFKKAKLLEKLVNKAIAQKRLYSLLSKSKTTKRFLNRFKNSFDIHSKYIFIPSSRTQDQLCYIYTKAARQEFVIDRHIYNLLEPIELQKADKELSFENIEVPPPKKLMLKRSWKLAHEYYMKSSLEYQEICQHVDKIVNDTTPQTLQIRNLSMAAIAFMQYYKGQFMYDVYYDDDFDNRILDLCPIPHIRQFLNKKGNLNYDLMIYLGIGKPKLEELTQLQHRRNQK